MLTSENEEKYIKGWQRRRKNKKIKLKQKKEKAMKKAKKISDILKTNYGITKVILFGSLAEDKFWENSDIDLAITGLSEKKYLKAFGEATDIASPFKVDLIIIEKAPEYLLKKINNRGIEI